MKSNKKLAQSLIEYGLILALVAVIAITALRVLGQKVNDAAVTAGDQVNKSTSQAAEAYCKQLGGTLDSYGACDIPESSNTP